MSEEAIQLSDMNQKLDGIDDRLIELKNAVVKVCTALLPLIEIVAETIAEERAAKKAK
jgi:hypothetical protein